LTNYDLLDTYLATDSVQRFMRTIRSSPEYWNKRKKELYAMVRQLGSPTFFMTYSPAEVDWPELIVLLAKTVNNDEITMEEAITMDREKVIDLIVKDPVTTARYFENRMDKLFAFIKNVYVGPFKDNPIQDSYDRTEMQKRGSPHNHSMQWLKDAPVFNTTNIYDPQNGNCIDFINKYITAASTYEEDITYDEVENTPEIRQANNDSLKKILRYQRHIHRANCRIEMEDLDDACQSGFPKPILDETIILMPLLKKTAEQRQIFNGAFEDFKTVKKHLDSIASEQEKDLKNKKQIYTSEKHMTMHPFLDSIPMSNARYSMALQASINKPTVFLKRSSLSIMINNYNRMIFLRHRANMDIQFIINSYALCTYVTSYMMKSNAVVSRLLKQAQDEMSRGNVSIKKQMFSIANKFQNCTEVSAQECVYHLLSMPVSRCTRESIYILTFKTAERYAMLKDKKILEILNKASSGADNIYALGLIDYYIGRPEIMKNKCLAEFASKYNTYTVDHYKRLTEEPKTPLFDEFIDSDDEDLYLQERQSDHDDSEDSSSSDSDNNDNAEKLKEFNKKPRNYSRRLKPENFIKLKEDMGYVRERNKLKIISYRKYNIKQDADNYYREQILLFMPWLDEKNQVENVDYFKVFEKNKTIIAENRAKFEKLVPDDNEAETLEEIEDIIAFQNQLDIANQADTLAEAHVLLMDDEQDPQVNIEVLEDTHGYHADLIDPEIRSDVAKDLQNQSKVKATKRMDDDKYKHLMIGLNRLQHTFLMNILHKIKIGEKFYEFVTGGAGTGKSRLISAIEQCIDRYLDHIIPKEKQFDKNGDKKIRVLLCAYTGKAAFNIKGTTIHTAFHFGENESQKMSEQTRLTIKKQYENLRLIIVDEISMVGAKLLFRVEERLRYIFDSQEPFANIPVIFFGDFNQLPPLMDQYAFQIDITNAYHRLQALDTNILWNKFRIFELKEIMRQRDDLAFAEALTRLGNYGKLGLTEQDIKILDSRIVQKEHIPKDSIYLFTINALVQKHNDYQLLHLPGNLYINKATNKVTKNKADGDKYVKYIKSIDKSKFNNVADEIMLKRGAKYMIINNINIRDGLANGTSGILRFILRPIDIASKPEIKIIGGFEAQIIYADSLWFDFQDDDVGREARQEHAKKYLKKYPETKDLTPLFPKDVKYKIQGKASTVTRTQFQVVESEALTVHKSQGQTYHRVAFDLSQTNIKRSSLYVALSRVTKLQDLYLYGHKSIIDGSQYSRYDDRQRAKLVQLENEQSKTHQELKRMRSDASFQNLFPILNEEQDGNTLWTMYHNVAGLSAHLDQIKADFAIQNADILFFAECHTNPAHKNKYKLDDFELIHLSGSEKQNASNGLACYIRADLAGRTEFVADNSKDGLYNSSTILEISCIRVKLKRVYHYFVYLYNHPKEKFANFYAELTKFLNQNIPDIGKDNAPPVYLFGDVNKDIHKKQDKLAQFKTHFGLVATIPKVPTTNYNTTIDWFMTNQTDIHRMTPGVYESYFSDHKPLTLELRF
jgi:hypothetical protein